MHSGEYISLVVKPREARRLLGDCSAETLYSLLRGELRSFRRGRSRLILRASITEYLERKLAEAAAGDNGLGGGRPWQLGNKAAEITGPSPETSPSPARAATPGSRKPKSDARFVERDDR
jgi:hypothetical protein